MKKSIVLLVAILFVGLQAVFAQSKTIKGTVTGEDGEAIPGVAVMVKGTTVGSVTNMDGEYTVKVPEASDVLVFTFVGMETKEVVISGDVIDVTLKSDAVGLEEVIAVGYGSATRASFTGTATKVDGEKLAAKNVSNVSQALVGESAGVTVINSSGQPGSVAKVRIRGFGSVNGNRAPLYVVDGVPLQGSMNSINPTDIESTTILKDAAATAIYGSRGANGVVLITTKKGKKGKSSIEVEAKYGVTMRLIPDYDVIENPEQYLELCYQGWEGYGRQIGKTESDLPAFANNYLFSRHGIDPNYNIWKGETGELIGEDGKFNSNIARKYTPEKWSDELFDNGSRQEVTTKLSGGNDKTTYYTSFGFLDEQGYYLSSDYERFTGRVNITHEVKPWLKGTANMSYTRSEMNNAGQTDDSTNGFWFVANMPSIYGVYLRDAEGNKIPDAALGTGYVYDFGGGQGYGSRGFGSLANPVATNNLDVNQTTANQFSLNASLVATFLKDFTFTSRFGLEAYNSQYDNLSNMWYGGAAGSGGSIYKNNSNVFAYTSTNMLSYSKEMGSHNFNAFVAQEAQLFRSSYMSAFKSNLADPYNRELNNAVVSSPSSSSTSEFSIVSYFGQVKYDYDEKYYVQAVLRRDGSSRFVDEKWGTFGSASAAWMISKEDFLSNASWLNELKLKASYGIMGDQGGSGYYPGYDSYSVENLDGQVAIPFSDKGNPNLTWESAKMFQVGAEFSVFNDRVEGAVDYYKKITDDLVFDRRVAPSQGYALYTVNDGDLENKGIEVNLTGHLVDTGDLTVDFNVNGAFLKNKMTTMPIEPATGLNKVIDIAGVYGRSKGHSLYDIYTREYAGPDETTGVSTWYRYYNEVDGEKKYISSMADYMAENEGKIGTIGRETTTKYDEATNKYIGKSAIPKVQGAFSFDIDYKGFEFTAQFTYSLGGYGMDYKYRDLMHDGQAGSNNWHKDILNAWTPDNMDTDVPVLTAGYNDLADRTSDRFVTSSDYLALNNVRLGYNFPKSLVKKCKLENVKIWVSGDNLYLKTARDGYYSALTESGASERYNYSPLSSVTGGVNIKF